MIIHLTGETRENTNRTLTLVLNALVNMLYVMKIRFNVKLKLKMRRNILHENNNIMNTMYLTVILSVKCCILGNLLCY
jgi:hypothetical protein